MKKQAELQRILSPLGINVLTADMAGIELSEVDETGETFEENALIISKEVVRSSGSIKLSVDNVYKSDNKIYIVIKDCFRSDFYRKMFLMIAGKKKTALGWYTSAV